jgi:hypothetical protein
METWATFSIIDHRKPIYRQALALFDRIVVPLPPKPIADQTQDELDQLKAEVNYLSKANAAVPYEWKSAEFEEWRRPLLAESLAARANRDPLLDTRLMLSEQFYSEGVLAIPVYGGLQHFADARKALMQVEEALTIEIAQRLPVPEYETPLENLVKLRQTPAFRKALDDLLEWKRDKAPAIVLAENRRNAIAAAMRDFDKLTKAYAEAMESEGYKKAGSVSSVFFALVTGELIGAIKEVFVSFRELREPCWKKVSEMKCAPGGVVYHFREEVGFRVKSTFINKT